MLSFMNHEPMTNKATGTRPSMRALEKSMLCAIMTAANLPFSTAC
jgi:hypothetical protein